MFEQLESFALKIYLETGKTLPFSQTLRSFWDHSELNNLYFMRDIKLILSIAEELDTFANTSISSTSTKTELLLDSYSFRSIRRNMYQFCQVPIKLIYEKEKSKKIVRHFFSELTYLKQVRLPGQNLLDYSIIDEMILKMNTNQNSRSFSLKKMAKLEHIHNILEVYLWLGNKYEKEFVEIDKGKLIRGV